MAGKCRKQGHLQPEACKACTAASWQFRKTAENGKKGRQADLACSHLESQGMNLRQRLALD
uniref:Macaca fascicularis brain cDNA clone: QbsA-11334, similar to human ADP-ribosylation factor-like 1 (ARL1), mRNA, RefSeq: NM_001177.3 n=1 Tax=Macaca fascicularis TaxID=9541 RepID=I7G3Z4_MACFA|nr:unnamed protein product [Macaca fascicularis]